METKDVKFSLSKVNDEEGTFEGYASVFGVVDSYNDVVEAGAFKKTLKEQQVFPLLWSHDATQPIGKVTGEEDNKGLKVKGDLNLEVGAAREKRSLMKQGVIKAMSIGFETVKDDLKEGVRLLKEIKLWEISLVVFPANRRALVTNVKSANELGELLEQILSVKALTHEQSVVAVKAMKHIETLLKSGQPAHATEHNQQPSLEAIAADLAKLRSTIQFN
ncbi:HK97 family phage prohead protease [Candidatus Pacearchaeota archaeon]|jgi:hypothetical protein|nr:HK97 family phage prohead protease [Candidatus Pacearchaeota archaeon]